MRRRARVELEFERLELPDGDFLDLAWVAGATGPCVLLLHGLEGGLDSHYVPGLLRTLADASLRPALLLFRNCGPEPNRLARSYHSGETGDLDFVAKRLAERHAAPLAGIVGFSLGGNVLLKWLGEQRERAQAKSAVAVSVPFVLADCAARLDRGASRLYQWHLMRQLRRAYARKRHLIPPDLHTEVQQLRNFRDFDDAVTAPLHGFAGVDDYYTRCSSRQFLADIRTRTLILQARDDPFMWPQSIPTAAELSAAVTLEVTKHGGHVGFVEGTWPWGPRYWLESRIVEFLADDSRT